MLSSQVMKQREGKCESDMSVERQSSLSMGNTSNGTTMQGMQWTTTILNGNDVSPMRKDSVQETDPQDSLASGQQSF